MSTHHDDTGLKMDFDPNQTLGWTARYHKDVIVVPWGENDPGPNKRAAGLFDASGFLIEAGHCQGPSVPIQTVEPLPPDAPERTLRLEGKWLFGGLLYGDFDNFLVESTGRLWAVDELQDLTGILYFPLQRLHRERRHIRHILPLLGAMGLGHLDVRAPQIPTLVDQLAVPPTGFGRGELSAGRPEYRAWINVAFGRPADPQDAEDLYIPNPSPPPGSAQDMLADQLEHLMVSEGYRVFRPAEHPHEVQIAEVKAARRIVGSDFAALRMAAMAVPTSAQVALLEDGAARDIQDLQRQLKAFAGIEPVRVLTQPQSDQTDANAALSAAARLTAVGETLADHGFISSRESWTATLEALPALDRDDDRAVSAETTPQSSPGITSGKAFACALTHVRHESFFLEKWIEHYGKIVGRENLYVVIDGDDWEPDVDLTGIHTEVLLGAPRQRISSDRFMAAQMSSRANQLRRSYHYVIRGDCDEYVVVDPASGLDWGDALGELGDDGYVFALGIDVVQSQAETDPVNRALPILDQRRFGFVADRYSKPFVISRWLNWAGGAHRLLNRPVKLSNHFVLFHMALSDQSIAEERLNARGGTEQHRSFVQHQMERLHAIAGGALAQPIDFVEASRIAHAEFPFEEDGSPAKRPRASRDPRGAEQGLPVIIPDRFKGLV